MASVVALVLASPKTLSKSVCLVIYFHVKFVAGLNILSDFNRKNKKIKNKGAVCSGSMQ